MTYFTRSLLSCLAICAAFLLVALSTASSAHAQDTIYVKNEGVYVATFYIYYDGGGKKGHWRSKSLTRYQTDSFKLPAGAKAIQLRGEILLSRAGQFEVVPTVGKEYVMKGILTDASYEVRNKK